MTSRARSSPRWRNKATSISLKLPDEARSLTVLEALACSTPAVVDTTLQQTIAHRAQTGYEQFYSRKRYVAQYLDLVKDIGRKKGITVQ